MRGKTNRTIISYKSLDVRLTDTADEDIFQLLGSNTLGSKGGMRHQLMNISEKIKAYDNNIRFASLYLRKRLTGTVGLCYRKISTSGHTYHSSYLRYFSFMPAFQAALDSRGAENIRRKDERADTWKEKVLEFIRKPDLLDFHGFEKDARHVVYAHVESMNERSKNFIDLVGFRHARTFNTMAFSRFRPGRSSRVIRLGEDEKGKMKELLSEFYSEYSFYSDDLCFYGDRYYVVKDGNEILAGLSAFPSSFRIIDMPGRRGRFTMRVFPHIPFLKKIFRPEELRFLVFEFLYYRKGYEKSLQELMESVCDIEGYNLGLTWQDKESELHEVLSTAIDMGALNRLVETKPEIVLARFNNFSEGEEKPFFNQPAYISGFDFT